jgi:hypothetical protein
MREALRYLNNAKEILKKASVENGIYTDIKPVREAFGAAYLAVLEAIDAVLIKEGLTQKELPKSVDAYRKALQKYLVVHNGKLLKEFESLYNLLHVAGYYRKLLDRVDIVKDAFKATKTFIEKIGLQYRKTKILLIAKKGSNERVIKIFEQCERDPKIYTC